MNTGIMLKHTRIQIRLKEHRAAVLHFAVRGAYMTPIMMEAVTAVLPAAVQAVVQAVVGGAHPNQIIVEAS